jgi:hypothetical protein
VSVRNRHRQYQNLGEGADSGMKIQGMGATDTRHEKHDLLQQRRLPIREHRATCNRSSAICHEYSCTDATITTMDVPTGTRHGKHDIPQRERQPIHEHRRRNSRIWGHRQLQVRIGAIAQPTQKQPYPDVSRYSTHAFSATRPPTDRYR